MSSDLTIKEKLFVDVFDKNYKALCLYGAKLCGDFSEAEISCKRYLLSFGRYLKKIQKEFPCVPICTEWYVMPVLIWPGQKNTILLM